MIHEGNITTFWNWIPKLKTKLFYKEEFYELRKI